MLLLLAGVAASCCLVAFVLCGKKANTSLQISLKEPDYSVTRNMASGAAPLAASQGSMVPTQMQHTNNPNAHGARITINSMRAITDKAMLKVNAEFAAQQPMTAADGSTQSVSFVYWLHREGQTPPTLDDMITNATAALTQQKEAAHMLQVAIDRNDDAAMKHAAQAQVDASRRLAGESAFYTVELSLTPDYPPLLSFQKGLPAWIALQEQARSAASAAVGESMSLSGMLRIGSATPPILVFSGDAGRLAYVDIKTMTVRITPPKQARRTPHQAGRDNADRDARVSAQWQEFLSSGFSASQFSLDGLKDLSKTK